jgi:hypothetical protein
MRASAVARVAERAALRAVRLWRTPVACDPRRCDRSRVRSSAGAQDGSVPPAACLGVAALNVRLLSILRAYWTLERPPAPWLEASASTRGQHLHERAARGAREDCFVGADAHVAERTARPVVQLVRDEVVLRWSSARAARPPETPSWRSVNRETIVDSPRERCERSHPGRSSEPGNCHSAPKSVLGQGESRRVMLGST